MLELVSIVAGHTLIVVQRRLNAHRALTQPLLVGVARFETVVDVFSAQHLAGFGVHGKDLPRTHTAFGQHIFGLVVPHADFRGEGDVAVFGGDPARRAQTVTVEQAHGIATIGQYHAGRTIPRLHVHGVVLIERAQIGVHGLDVLPGWRNDHAHATEQVHAAGDHQLQHVVHARGVGAHAIDQRAQIIKVRQLVVGKLGAPRLSPVTVAGDGVDFTVVRQEAEWLRQRPLRQGVGGEALVEHADRGLQALVTQVRVELLQVRRHHQTFVDDGLRREAADVMLGIGGIGHRRATTGTEQLDGEVLVTQAFTTDEHLFNLRQTLQRQTAEHAGINWHFAPADQLQAGGEDFAIHVLAGRAGFALVLVEENHADCVLRWQLDRKRLLRSGTQEHIRLLHQQPAAVTCLTVGVDTAAVGHAGQGFNGCLQQVMACLALHMGNQAEAAVILELIRMVQTCFHRHSHQTNLY